MHCMSHRGSGNGVMVLHVQMMRGLVMYCQIELFLKLVNEIYVDFSIVFCLISSTFAQQTTIQFLFSHFKAKQMPVIISNLRRIVGRSKLPYVERSLDVIVNIVRHSMQNAVAFEEAALRLKEERAASVSSMLIG